MGCVGVEGDLLALEAVHLIVCIEDVATAVIPASVNDSIPIPSATTPRTACLQILDEEGCDDEKYDAKEGERSGKHGNLHEVKGKSYLVVLYHIYTICQYAI